MAEKIISPGVFTKENDLSFVQQGIGAIGAAVIGPTVKGPANVPTTVFSYSDFATIFGESFKSGSGTKADFYQYYTSIAAKDYLKHGGPLTVVRIQDILMLQLVGMLQQHRKLKQELQQIHLHLQVVLAMVTKYIIQVQTVRYLHLFVQMHRYLLTYHQQMFITLILVQITQLVPAVHYQYYTCWQLQCHYKQEIL